MCVFLPATSKAYEVVPPTEAATEIPPPLRREYDTSVPSAPTLAVSHPVAASYSFDTTPTELDAVSISPSPSYENDSVSPG